MSEFKGTPGPWNGKDVGICQQNRAGLQLGFITSSNEERVSECAANAMLIAAAPDLLAALIDMVSIVKKNTYPTPDKPDSVWGRMEVAESAISKATGE
ncbi:hypothetical protein [Buttiauxella gaviniae]|uniref:hypothetical protein n=1 Tax=Buttiauxella gaviniae TaxID=82990 RepID=UPI0039AF6749